MGTVGTIGLFDKIPSTTASDSLEFHKCGGLDFLLLKISGLQKPPEGGEELFPQITLRAGVVSYTPVSADSCLVLFCPQPRLHKFLAPQVTGAHVEPEQLPYWWSTPTNCSRQSSGPLEAKKKKYLSYKSQSSGYYLKTYYSHHILLQPPKSQRLFLFLFKFFFQIVTYKD